MIKKTELDLTTLKPLTKKERIVAFSLFKENYIDKKSYTVYSYSTKKGGKK